MTRRLAIIVALTCLACACCQREDPDSPMAAVRLLEKGCADKDVGLVMVSVDLHYQDDLGGPGRLEDDLRRLFSVYGGLLLKHQDVTIRDGEITGHTIIEGKGLRYEGPHKLQVTRKPGGPVISSGVMTDMRGIIETLRERRLAVENAQIDRLDRLVSVEYKGTSGGKQEFLDRLKADLAAVQAQALIVNDVSIVVGGDEAKVTQSFLLITQAEGKKLENRDRERIILRKEGSRWRITGGLG